VHCMQTRPVEDGAWHYPPQPATLCTPPPCAPHHSVPPTPPPCATNPTTPCHHHSAPPPLCAATTLCTTTTLCHHHPVPPTPTTLCHHHPCHCMQDIVFTRPIAAGDTVHSTVQLVQLAARKQGTHYHPVPPCVPPDATLRTTRCPPARIPAPPNPNARPHAHTQCLSLPLSPLFRTPAPIPTLSLTLSLTQPLHAAPHTTQAPCSPSGGTIPMLW
jgi:hypothetical protein